ncbi:MAG: RagB/SusD family nutrient uptake outer membrane protein [Ekhidna sp.]
MKIKSFIIILFVLAAYSCENKLDIAPEFSLTSDNAFESAEEYDQILIGAYATLNNNGYYAETYGELMELGADGGTETAESLRNEAEFTDWQFGPSDGSGNVAAGWNTPYLMIARANVVSDGINDVPETTAGSRNRILGQALALRALGHFDLLRLYGQAYERNSTALGVPVRITQTLDNPVRATVSATYDQILADLNQAETLLDPAGLDVSPNTGGTRYRIDRLVVRAIRAKVNLYAGEYAAAVADATAVIGDGAVSIGTTASFSSIWDADDQNTEVIWSVAVVDQSEGRPTAEMFFYVNNRMGWVPSADVLSLYDQANDIRFSSYFSNTFNISAVNGGPDRNGTTVSIKYSGRNGAIDGVNDIKIFRMGEMYLIRSEAQFELNQPTLAMQDLNTLRSNRITGYVDQNLTGISLETAIQNERRKELWLEGHRWFDLRRWNQAITRGADCASPMEACSLAADSFRRIFPIPTTEVVVSGIEQNDQY